MTTILSGIESSRDRIHAELSEQIGSRKYAMWFERSAALDLHEGELCLHVAVPSRFVADWIKRHFHNDLREAAARTLGQTRTQQGQAAEGEPVAPDRITVAIEIDPSRFANEDVRRSQAGNAAAAPEPSVHASPRSGHRPHATAAPASPRRHTSDIAGLRSVRLRHSLHEFVTGASNELAFAAAEKLAGEAEPGHPLFLYGACGLGKTHLLQGVCQRMLDRDPEAKVLYTTGEQFTNAYIAAVRANKLDAFRRSVRSLDLLAVDDVHFIANKQATQQEFLHSFEQIELTGARLALASDQHPKSIQQFSEGLVSRCVRGPVVEIHMPDAETRRRIVRTLVKRRGLLVTDVVIDLFARKWTGSVRELEGMLAKLQAMASLHHGRLTAPIGRSLAEKMFHHDGPSRPRTPARFDNILAAVIDVTGVPREALLGRGRQKPLVLARSLLIHITRELTAMSYPELATAMGKRTHSTVITADQRMHAQLRGHEVYT
ncbi:MAG: DnaA ATPase domain-containing protein, partial [Phycisphaeraceae bacterium]